MSLPDLSKIKNLLGSFEPGILIIIKSSVKEKLEKLRKELGKESLNDVIEILIEHYMSEKHASTI